MVVNLILLPSCKLLFIFIYIYRAEEHGKSYRAVAEKKKEMAKESMRLRNALKRANTKIKHSKSKSQSLRELKKQLLKIEERADATGRTQKRYLYV